MKKLRRDTGAGVISPTMSCGSFERIFILRIPPSKPSQATVKTATAGKHPSRRIIAAIGASGDGGRSRNHEAVFALVMHFGRQRMRPSNAGRVYCRHLSPAIVRPKASTGGTIMPEIVVYAVGN